MKAANNPVMITMVWDRLMCLRRAPDDTRTHTGARFGSLRAGLHAVGRALQPHRQAAHLADIKQLLGLLDRLVDSGKSVIVIEHHQSVMAHADWIIDLGPGAGHDGGRVVFEGTPADLVKNKSTLTGKHLAEFVASHV